MAPSNVGKWKVFTDGQIIYGPAGSGQNLNEDLQKNLANELDSIIADALGDGVSSGFGVSAGAGLSVNIAAGDGYAGGQRAASSGVTNIPSLPPSTSGIKVYFYANTPYSTSLFAWTAAFGYTTGALSAGQVLLATVTTDGSGVTGVVDARSWLEGQATIAATIDDTGVAPAATAYRVRDRLSMLANMVKQITGGASWLTAPGATIATLWGKFDASTGHAHSGAAGDGAQVSHASLASLTTGDPHTQYVKKAGDTSTGDQSIKKSAPAQRFIGTEGSAKDYQWIESAGLAKLQRNDGSEGTPTWTDILSIDLANLNVTIKDGFPVRILMPTPAIPTATPSASGGTLATNTYYYKIVAVDAAGNLTPPSPERSASVTGPSGSVALSWTAIPGAASYRIYRGTSSSGENVYYTSTTNSYTDTNATSTGGTPPATTSQAFVVQLSANDHSIIAGETAGGNKNLYLGYQVRCDVLPDARLVLPVGANKYAV